MTLMFKVNDYVRYYRETLLEIGVAFHRNRDTFTVPNVKWVCNADCMILVQTHNNSYFEILTDDLNYYYTVQ